MPIVSIFFGIVVRMYHDDHSPPHFHATYGEFEAVFEIKTGTLIGGSLTPKARKLVEEWRKKHLAELSAAWNAVTLMKAPKRIKGLE